MFRRLVFWAEHDLLQNVEGEYGCSLEDEGRSLGRETQPANELKAFFHDDQERVGVVLQQVGEEFQVQNDILVEQSLQLQPFFTCKLKRGRLNPKIEMLRNCLKYQ